jgi:hypothetical protein
MEQRELIFFIQGFFGLFSTTCLFSLNIFFICLRSLILSVLFVGHILFSAVDQFDKQFTHLEETGGKSDPVVPLERKHASLPR